MKLKLDDSQRKALKDIESCLIFRAKQIKDLLALRAKLKEKGRSGEDLGQIQLAADEDIANSFGILGPRGAGKSTILRALYETRAKDLGPDLFFLPPLDCSLVGSDVSPGAAILLHLERELSKMSGLSKLEQLRRKLMQLAGLYVAGTNEFRSLVAEWVSGVGDYKEFALNGVSDRLRLRGQLGDWLRDTANEVGTTAFVVLLDDFDLVHAEEVRRWMLALLDELRQPRFLIVLTADFYRLEHLSLDPEAEFDDKTGRALLGKMLPTQNRVTLDRWAYDARENFGAKSINPKASGRGKTDENSGGLGQAIAAFGWNRKAQVGLLKRLLPGWPRGLVNLHARLTERRSVEGRSERDKMASFLSILGSCRAEPLLARELRATPLTAWVRSLRFKSEDISVEDWQETVEIAEEREWSKRGVDFRPIQLLRPILPLSHQMVGVEGRRGHEVVAELAVQADLDRSDVSGQDSLRHDFLRVKPLRDAQHPAVCYWAELLVNFGMIVPPSGPREGGSASAKHEATRNRIFFLDHWGPVQERLSQAELNIKGLHPGEFREWFLDNDDLPLSCLLWMSWRGKERIDLRIGWPPLLSALRRARRPLEREKMSDLLLNPNRFEGARMSGGSPEELELIPDEVWAIILLVDALDRCPWRALGGTTEWRVHTYLLLAVAFVRSSYFYALIRAGELAWDPLSPDQAWFVQALGSRDPWGFFNVNEEDLVEKILNLMGDKLEDKISKSSSLSCAAHAFFSSAAYIDLRALALRLPA